MLAPKGSQHEHRPWKCQGRAAGDIFPEKKMGFIPVFQLLGKGRSQMFSVWQLKAERLHWGGMVWEGWLQLGTGAAAWSRLLVFMFLIFFAQLKGDFPLGGFLASSKALKPSSRIPSPAARHFPSGGLSRHPPEGPTVPAVPGRHTMPERSSPACRSCQAGGSRPGVPVPGTEGPFLQLVLSRDRSSAGAAAAASIPAHGDRGERSW